MGEFFKGWRRRIGVLTSLIACVATAGWIRSQSIADTIQSTSNSGRIDLLCSSSSKLVWRRVLYPSEVSPSTPPKRTFSWISTPLNTFSTQVESVPGHNEIRWNLWGVSLTETTLMEAKIIDWSVPDWYVILPLTLVSGWLLLSKPPQTIAKSPVEPIKESVA